MSRQVVEASIDIQATPRWVWRVLTGLSAYQHWNPLIPVAHGRVEPGRMITLHVRPARARSLRVRARVTKVVDERELRWEGRWYLPLLLRCQHTFRVDDLGSHRVRLHQRQEYKGLLVSLFWSNVQVSTESRIRAMNAALKQRAERVDRIASFPKPGRKRVARYEPDSPRSAPDVTQRTATESRDPQVEAGIPESSERR
jgi:hypothetical protein